MERTTGIELASSAWEADILPMNYVRISYSTNYTINLLKMHQKNFRKIILNMCLFWLIFSCISARFIMPCTHFHTLDFLFLLKTVSLEQLTKKYQLCGRKEVFFGNFFPHFFGILCYFLTLLQTPCQ